MPTAYLSISILAHQAACTATVFETAGGIIGPEEIKALLQNKNIKYLAEMMNFPGVITGPGSDGEKSDWPREAGKNWWLCTRIAG